MRKYFPVVVALCIVGIAGAVVVYKKNEQSVKTNGIGTVFKKYRCAKTGKFFAEKGISGPVTIDLSQKKYKGIALYYGANNDKVYHPKSWERFEHMSTYAADKQGNLYLVPMPFISIRPTTFNLLKNLYKIDTNTGKLSIFMHFDDIRPSPNNPYGLNAVVYDCDDDTLWVSAIDESNYETQKGVIYHIDLKNKKILQRFNGWDALSLTLLKTEKKKFLLFGSARDSGLYAIEIEHSKLVGNPKKLFEIANPVEHIRKIKVKGKKHLQVETIPFSYTLITESSKKDRVIYHVTYKNEQWQIKKL